MSTTANELPWRNAPDAVACNLAFGHLVRNLPPRLTISGRLHAETYISAVGAIAGYAAQRTLFAASPPVMGVNINRVDVASGDHYWFGDTLNFMLVPNTESGSNRCVWSLAAGAAVAAGLPLQQLPKLDAMFRHVAATIGDAGEGKSSVASEHQAHLPARDLLKVVWPMAMMCFSGKFPNASRDFGVAPVLVVGHCRSGRNPSHSRRQRRAVTRHRTDAADGNGGLLQQARSVEDRGSITRR